MISLSTCVKGQKLRLRNEDIIEYKGPNYCNSNTYNHAAYRNGKRFTYTDSGSYFYVGQDMRDVIEILPLETTDPASHPSIAWWESCPWITDRNPTKEDADAFGRVLVKPTEPAKIQTAFFQDVRIKEAWIEAWIHYGNWQPPVLSDKEKALELINNHSPEGNGIVEDNWKPTTEQWLVICKGLEAS